MRFIPAALAVAALGCLAGCGTLPAVQHAATGTAGCLTVVHGEASGRGSLEPGWLPGGFRLLAGSQSSSSLPDSTYTEASKHQDPPRIEFGTFIQAAPLTAAVGGRPDGKPVEVQGHGGFLESGPPGPQFIGVYWKPAKKYVVSVVGYQVSAATVLKVARTAAFTPPGLVRLPVQAGRIVSRQTAIKVAEQAKGGASRSAVAKLSSWTEVQALAAHTGRAPAGPGVLSSSPWLPVWAVRLAGSSSVEIVGARSGQAEAQVSDRGSWFTALTDRSAAGARDCPGGSTALVPFGVLTRDEQTFLSGRPATGSVRLVLSTVPAVNKADNGLYGGCIQVNCSVDQLVWVTITVVRAAPGKTVACLPGDISVPAGYKPRGVKEYYSVSVPDNASVGCKPPPAALSGLKDLAPPG